MAHWRCALFAHWSSGDFALPRPAVDAGVALVETGDAIKLAGDIEQPDDMSIGAVVARIESWRRDRENRLAPQLPFEPAPEDLSADQIDGNRFETNDDGTIVWVEVLHAVR
ncbi:MAG: hypothetical protein IPP23_10025 [Sphingomonadales bacterium]|nr:hypothetical protein [Sphingomonadales bacterium]